MGWRWIYVPLDIRHEFDARLKQMMLESDGPSMVGQNSRRWAYRVLDDGCDTIEALRLSMTNLKAITFA
jgi:hypothetical protein